MLDRVIDWIDTQQGEAMPEGQQSPIRIALANRFLAMIEAHLASAEARWGLVFDDKALCARVWLYGVVGHLRCAVIDANEREHWVEGFTRFFLKAALLP